ncbi:hypothetical protein HY479_02095 [Candidatus Uhrbacteria bacterium]|nr:hypothetical protein [Candidatus Uhrbacteria bacterium]
MATIVVVCFLLLTNPANTNAAMDGALVKTAQSSSVYYLWGGKRYAFPNEKIFFSWYPDFSSVTIVSSTELSGAVLSANVPYKPGRRLIKITSSPTVYAVGGCAVLHPLGSESVAQDLFGVEWNTLVDDLPDSFFSNYTVGAPIQTPSDFIPDAATQRIIDAFCATQKIPDLGVNASLHGKRFFEDSIYWNQDISQSPVDPDSSALIAKIGMNDPINLLGASLLKQGKRTGIGYVVVGASQPFVPVTNNLYKVLNDFTSAPVPPNVPIEDANTDRHAIVFDRDNEKLYEFWKMTTTDGGQHWTAGTNVLWVTTAYVDRPDAIGSADAAGLPILPGLVRYDEVVEQKAINHALRFLIRDTSAYYVYPATKGERHSSAPDPYDPALPPMGMRVRLKATVDISSQPQEIQIVLTALKKYGMILADHTDGLDWSLIATKDERWDATVISTISQSGISGKDFEVVQMGPRKTYGTPPE